MKDDIMATNSRKTYIGLLTAVLAISGSVLLVSESIMAQPAGPLARMDPARMDKMVEQHVERMAKAVNATPEQKAKLLDIAKATQSDIKPMHEQIRARMDKARAESNEVLTPEQRKVWEEKMKSMRGRTMEHMGERMKKHD